MSINPYLCFVFFSCSPFTYGWDTEIPELSEAVTKKILTKCVATMFAHIGFESSIRFITIFEKYFFFLF